LYQNLNNLFVNFSETNFKRQWNFWTSDHFKWGKKNHFQILNGTIRSSHLSLMYCVGFFYLYFFLKTLLVMGVRVHLHHLVRVLLNSNLLVSNIYTPVPPSGQPCRMFVIVVLGFYFFIVQINDSADILHKNTVHIPKWCKERFPKLM
jgi:hypothetical protein